MACMNSSCGVSSSSVEWRKGWALRSGGFANLCDKCGSAYEQSLFCEVFHSAESGWRECVSCGKRLHCGCAVSKFIVELLDGGGVKCNGCAKSFGIRMTAKDDKPNGIGTSKLGDQFNGINADRLKLVQLSNPTEGIGFHHLLQPQNEMFHKMKHEDGSQYLLSLNQGSNGTSDIPNLTMTLGSSLGGSVVEERPPSLFLHHGARSRNVLPRPHPRSSFAPPGVETSSTSMGSQVRVARPPAEGRGRNQLLPRYWPRITDQELQQISGDSNATIVPLFEKMLSASDAGRIGRLVLPKACAEAYFPPISQPEGLPLKIQDVKGKEWVFQFRFWPNNNSRMYVLEGVTPCIQSMQLQAGDTVTFSRMDPEGKLIMGFRKASTSVAMQDTHQSVAHNGALSNEAFFSGVFENLPIISGYSGLLQSLKGSSDTNLNSSLSKHLTSSTSAAELSWRRLEKNEGKSKEGFVMSSSSPLMIPDRKRARNIGSKFKRLHMDSQDVLEIRLTWEYAQDLLRPSTKPSTVVIEDIEIEEYEEPPVFGKRSVFIVRITGEQEQWAQCDVCLKWRRLPNDVLVPNKWSCADNAWDPARCSCSVPDEMTPQEQESLIRQNKEIKRQRTTTTTSSPNHPENESSGGLDALANAAALGEPTSSVVAAAMTTKHPRHRAGCSCIVCIQPPSGKGKHKPSCVCNVCMTVKRRFKTLMLNKKKRQSEREAEIAARSHPDSKKEESLDLNCNPGREVSMTTLLHVATRPLEAYLKQTGIASLAQPTTMEDSEEQEQEQEQQPNEEQESGVGQEQSHQSDPQIKS